MSSPGPAVEHALLEAFMEQQRHVGIGVCDRDGVLTAMSPVLEESLGVRYSPTCEPVWAGRYYLHDEHGDPLPAGGDPLARALRGEDVSDQAVSVRRPGTPVRWLLCSGLRLRDKRRGVIGAAVFVHDITARVEAQQRLDALRDRLVETVNHEVRTPLATISGHLELLEKSALSLPEPVQWSLQALNRASTRLKVVVATISDLADQSQQTHDPDRAKPSPR